MCVEAAQSAEQQAQVDYEVVQLAQPQPAHPIEPKEKKVFKCQVCGKIFAHTGEHILNKPI